MNKPGWGPRRTRTAWLLALLVAGTLPAARAELWGYIDASGAARFATEKLDERYELFSRGGESFDSATGLRRQGAPRTAPAIVPTAPPRLVGFFDSSPTYRQVKQHLREASDTHGIDYELLKALIVTESGFNTRAVSPKGAVGLMQIMPATAERYGVSGDSKMPIQAKLADPKTNIKTGARYLRFLLNLFPGRLELALAAYNAGEGAVQRAGNRIPNYPETQNYVRTVLQLYGVLKPAAAGAASIGASGGSQGPRVRMQLPGLPANGGPRAREGDGMTADAMSGPAMSTTMGAGRATLPSAPGGAVNRGNLPPATSATGMATSPAVALEASPAGSDAAPKTERD